MNDSVFDRLYECTINDGNDEYLTGEFYKSEAIRYMAETEALKTELQSCRNRYKLDQIKRDMSYEQLRIALKKLEREITSKDREIKKLTTSIKNFQRFESTNLKVPDRFETEKMNHKDIAFKTRIVLEKISNDKQRYSCTGRFETISDRIDEVRTLFNQLLKQLNDFNSENKDISKTLASLLQLDVRI